MQYSKNILILILAEKIAENYGDINWFREHYVLLRENHGIAESALRALDAQDLRKHLESVVKGIQDQLTVNKL